MGGSSIQLYALGPQDYHLTANPQITFFKSVFKRHTNFTKDIRRIFFSENTPSLGSKETVAKINIDGDLLSSVYLEVDITGTVTNANAGKYTINHFGNSLVKKVELEIGGFIIDTHYSQWLQIHDELTHNISEHNTTMSDTHGGLDTSLNLTTGSHDSYEINSHNRVTGNCPLIFGGQGNYGSNVVGGTYTKKFIIPLKFWFTKNPGMYLPLSALYKHEIKLRFSFEEETKLKGTHDITNFKSKIKLFGEFIHLDEDEKRRFSQSNHEYIIEQVQLNNNGPFTTTSTTDTSITTQLINMDYELNFLHPVKYFVWVIVNEGVLDSNLGTTNIGQGPCYFTSLCSNSIYGNDGYDGNVEILLDGIEREMTLPMIYYTRMYPKKYCNYTPELDRIGMYSFALNPFSAEPSGTCNFSKINDKNIKISFANNDVTKISGKPLYFFAVNYNVLIITDGMAAIRYT